MGAKLIGIGGGPGVDPYVAALGPSQFLQSLTEGCNASLTFRIVRRGTYEHPDEPYPLWLLRARRKRPRRRAAGQRDECAPFHSITSSARASSVGLKAAGAAINSSALA
jgi:hypothetical protein